MRGRIARKEGETGYREMRLKIKQNKIKTLPEKKMPGEYRCKGCDVGGTGKKGNMEDENMQRPY